MAPDSGAAGSAVKTTAVYGAAAGRPWLSGRPNEKPFGAAPLLQSERGWRSNLGEQRGVTGIGDPSPQDHGATRSLIRVRPQG